MIGCHGGDDIERGEVNKRGEEETKGGKGMKGEEEISGIRQLIQE